MKVREREIREAVYSALIVAAILGTLSVLRTIIGGLPLKSIVTWIGARLAQPVTMPVGMMFLIAVFMTPTLLRIMRKKYDEEDDTLRLIPPTEIAAREGPVLFGDETSIMLAFAKSGRVDMFPEELNAGLYLSEIRLSQALDDLLNRDFIKYRPRSYVAQRPASASLTPVGRSWLLDNGHA